VTLFKKLESSNLPSLVILVYDGATLKSNNGRTRPLNRKSTAARPALQRGGAAMDGLLRSLIKTVRRRVRADEELTVEAVTKELGYTRQYVSGRFHRITGRLLSHFLKEKRLEKAARLLKSGNLRISQIARRCGFDSENYFRQQFRERFGMSPRQFRANGTLRALSNGKPAFQPQLA
jgi:AraC-like DNA-binding protein